MTTVVVCGASLLFSIIASQLAAAPALTAIIIDPKPAGCSPTDRRGPA